MPNRFQFIFILSIAAIFLTLIMTDAVLAYVMSSSNYRIQSDSMNVGGLRQTSTNYWSEDTIGEIATGLSTSTSYRLQAGYQAMQEVFLSISAPASVSLGSLGGLAGGTANTSATITVTTDSPAGYNLGVKATSSPALVSGANSLADYTEASAGTPDYNWSIEVANSEFGFAPYNANSQVQKYKNNGSACNTGANITDSQCWYPFSTTNEIVANRSTPIIQGEDTKINLRAEIKTSGGFQEEGAYNATMVATALAN